MTVVLPAHGLPVRTILDIFDIILPVNINQLDYIIILSQYFPVRRFLLAVWLKPVRLPPDFLF